MYEWVNWRRGTTKHSFDVRTTWHVYGNLKTNNSSSDNVYKLCKHSRATYPEQKDEIIGCITGMVSDYCRHVISLLQSAEALNRDQMVGGTCVGLPTIFSHSSSNRYCPLCKQAGACSEKSFLFRLNLVRDSGPSCTLPSMQLCMLLRSLVWSVQLLTTVFHILRGMWRVCSSATTS